MQFLHYQEDRKRGVPDFPIEFHHVAENHPQYIMMTHWHLEYELIRVLEGKFYLTIDEESLILEKGDAAFIPSGALHSGTPESCVYECLVWDQRFLMNRNQECCRLIQKTETGEIEPIHYISSGEQPYQTLISPLFHLFAEPKEGTQMAVIGILYTLFGIICLNGRVHPAADAHRGPLKRTSQLKTALEYMESHYTHPLTLSEIAESVHLSPKYFCRFFKEMTHQTPIEYLNACRIEHACSELLTGSDSITDIAFNAGFTNLSHFIRLFRKHTGLTPSRYRKEPGSHRG